MRLELQQIEAELEKDPRFRRAKAIRGLLADYEGAAALSPSPMPAITPGTKYQAIKKQLDKLMAGGRRHRGEMLNHLKSQGLMGHEKDPMASLAHYLTTSGFYKSVGDGYWTLK